MKKTISSFTACLLVFALLLTLGSGSPASDDQLSVLPGYSEVVFVSWGDGGWDIYHLHHTEISRLTSDPGSDVEPAGAPGGGRIAFASDRDGNWNIWVMDFDGTNLERVTSSNAADRTPTWAGMGDRLVFTSDREDNQEIWTIGIDGENPTRVTHNDWPDYQPAFSPEGEEIVFVSYKDWNLDIYTVSADGSHFKQITATEEAEFFPQWSHDGRRIVYGATSLDTGESDLWIADIDGGDRIHLVSGVSTGARPVWSSDDEWILFTSDRDGEKDAFAIPSTGKGSPTNLTADFTGVVRDADFLWPKVPIHSEWEDKGDWIPAGVPDRNDRVAIAGGICNITRETVKDIMSLDIERAGVLQGDGCSVLVRARKGITVWPGGAIVGGQHGDHGYGLKVHLDASPGDVSIGGLVEGGAGRSENNWSEDGGKVRIIGHSVSVAATGLVCGGAGGLVTENGFYPLSGPRGGDGGDIRITAERISVAGCVAGGSGGDTDAAWNDDSSDDSRTEEGGDGGTVHLWISPVSEKIVTLTTWRRELTIPGVVCGGLGGSIMGKHGGSGGQGGDVMICVDDILAHVTTEDYQTNPPAAASCSDLPPANGITPGLGGQALTSEGVTYGDAGSDGSLRRSCE